MGDWIDASVLARVQTDSKCEISLILERTLSERVAVVGLIK